MALRISKKGFKISKLPQVSAPALPQPKINLMRTALAKKLNKNTPFGV